MIAAGMIVLGSALDLPQVVMIAGVIVMIFAVALAAVAVALTLRLRTTLALDPDSITIIRGRRRRVLGAAEAPRARDRDASPDNEQHWETSPLATGRAGGRAATPQVITRREFSIPP